MPDIVKKNKEVRQEASKDELMRNKQLQTFNSPFYVGEDAQIGGTLATYQTANYQPLQTTLTTGSTIPGTATFSASTLR